jgi:hypothetical protein
MSEMSKKRVPRRPSVPAVKPSPVPPVLMLADDERPIIGIAAIATAIGLVDSRGRPNTRSVKYYLSQNRIPHFRLGREGKTGQYATTLAMLRTMPTMAVA